MTKGFDAMVRRQDYTQEEFDHGVPGRGRGGRPDPTHRGTVFERLAEAFLDELERRFV